jgi:hypothetical protein
MTQSRFYTAETLVALETSQAEMLDALKWASEVLSEIPDRSSGEDDVLKAVQTAITNGEKALTDSVKVQP